MGCDISNYTGPLAADRAAAWRANGIGRVVVQAVNPPPQYPAGCTAQQIRTLQAAGIATDLYVYLWMTDSGLMLFADCLNTAAGFKVGRIWVDVEDVTKGPSPNERLALLQRALMEADACGLAAKPSGIYTGAWYADRYLPNDLSSLKDRALWFADYDGIADPSVWVPFGPWTAPAAKQYAGTSTLFGVGNVDLDVFAPEA